MNQPPKRIVIKVGSNVLARPDGSLDVTRMSALTDQIAELQRSGIEVILVSSGAVAAGRSEIAACVKKKLDSVDSRQLFSAVGQAKLINRYYELFREHDITVGQVLTTKENFSTRRHYLNQKNCMTVMIENGIIPIVNENDTISVCELMFTDNDELSGLLASMMNAAQLIILSNIDGIYDGAPDSPTSKVIREIQPDDDLSRWIQTGKSTFGRGGMLTKTSIARKVAGEGIEVIIANGKQENILLKLIREPEHTIHTRFAAASAPVSGIKKWIAHSEDFAKGELHLNPLATAAVTSDKAVSILPVGITDVRGAFEKDDIVRIISADGTSIGVGKVNYNAAQVREVMGKHGKKPVVHYDYLYLE
jgi:glutamate 5-kinase